MEYHEKTPANAKLDENLNKLFFELMKLEIEAVEKKEKIADNIQEIVDLCK